MHKKPLNNNNNKKKNLKQGYFGTRYKFLKM